MAIIGIVLGVIGAAVGVVVGAVGGLLGIVLGLLGGSLGLLPFLFPILLITLGVIWLVKGSSTKNLGGARAYGGGPTPPPNPGNPR